MLALLALVHREILIFAVVGLIIGGMDDLIIDLLYFGRRCWRNMAIYTRYPRMTTATLPPSPCPGRLAIFIPAWQESAVIAAMLANTLRCWGDADYRIFVGAYPNDPETLAAIGSVAAGQHRIIVGVNNREGPTTKADCLNMLWRAMLREEQRGIM